MMQELDVRDLAAPEPFEQIIALLRGLAEGESVLVHIHREPFPLYDVLSQNHFSCQTDKINEHYFQIKITRESRPT